MTSPDATDVRSAPYELFILGLSVFVILALVVEVVVPLAPGSRAILRYADTAICVVFLFDFVRSVVKAPSRGRYLLTWGWVDFLSSIPLVGYARIGRLVRVVRVVRLLRGFRSVHNLISFLLLRRAQSALATVSLVSVLLVVFSSVAVLQFELLDDGANIRSAQDALWWAYVTITTVGYGDRFPVTPEGRLIGAVLMTAGVGLFGTFTASMASWLMAAPAQSPASAPAGVRPEALVP